MSIAWSPQMLSGALSFYLVQLVSVAVLSGLRSLQMWIVFGLTSLYVLAIFVLDAGQVGFWPIAMLVLMVSLLVITTTAMDFSQRVVFRRKLKLKQLNQFHEGEIDTFSVDALSNWVASANESTMEEGTNGHKSESLLLFQVEAEEVEILDKIGAGGAGMVFKGRYCHHKVAVKQIYAAAFSGSSDREALAEFSKEVTALKKLHHPYIIGFYGICKMGVGDDASINIIMEYAPMSLAAELEQDVSWIIPDKRETVEALRAMSPEERRSALTRISCPYARAALVYSLSEDTGERQKILDLLPPHLRFETEATLKHPEDLPVSLQRFSVVYRLAYEISSAMCYLHANEILHLDLKPDNILLTQTNDSTQMVSRLTDFGLSEIKKDGPVSNSIGGSPGYVPPEIARRMPEYPGFNDPKNQELIANETAFCTETSGKTQDVFAFGVVLAAMCSQNVPYPSTLVDRDGHQQDLDSGAALLEGVVDYELRPKVTMTPMCDHTLTLMQQCWAECPGDRPDFTSIRNQCRHLAAAVK